MVGAGVSQDGVHLGVSLLCEFFYIPGVVGDGSLEQEEEDEQGSSG